MWPTHHLRHQGHFHRGTPSHQPNLAVLPPHKTSFPRQSDEPRRQATGVSSPTFTISMMDPCPRTGKITVDSFLFFPGESRISHGAWNVSKHLYNSPAESKLTPFFNRRSYLLLIVAMTMSPASTCTVCTLPIPRRTISLLTEKLAWTCTPT